MVKKQARPSGEKRELVSIAEIYKYVPIGLSKEQYEKLHDARVKLRTPIAEIVRHATFEVYLPSALKEK